MQVCQSINASPRIRISAILLSPSVESSIEVSARPSKAVLDTMSQYQTAQVPDTV